jgi:hypothetical protein
VTIFANGIAFTVAAAIVPELWRTSDLKIFFPLVFCALGIILAVRGDKGYHPAETFWPNLF